MRVTIVSHHEMNLEQGKLSCKSPAGLKNLPENPCDSLRLEDHPVIIRMNPLNHAVIVPTDFLTGQIVEISEFLPQLPVQGFLSVIQAAGIEPVMVREIIGIAAVLHQYNRAGMICTKKGNAFLKTGLKIILDIYVRQAVNDIGGSIYLIEKSEHFFLHPAVSRKTEIHDRAAQASFHNACPGHPRTASAGPLGYARAIDHYGQVLPDRKEFKDTVLIHSQFKTTDGIIQREIETVGVNVRLMFIIKSFVIVDYLRAAIPG